MRKIAPFFEAHAFRLLVGLTLAAAVWLLVADLRVKNPNSCRTFYYAATALVTGGDLYGSHAPGADPQYVYPPLFALAFVPLSWLALVNATRVWLVVNVALTILALAFGTAELMRRFRVPREPRMFVGLACGAFLLSFGEVKTEWATGQTDTMILLAFVLALRWIDRLPWLAGAAIGLAANIKYQTLVALPWMLLRRRWAAASAVALAAVGFGLLPAFVSGWSGNLRNVGTAFAGLGKFLGIPSHAAAPTVDMGWERSISIMSAAARLAKAAHLSASAAAGMGGLAALAFLGVIAWLYGSQSFRLLGFRAAAHERVPKDAGVVAIEWIGLMVAWIAFGPEVSRRHMFVLIFLHSLVLVMLANRENRFAKKPLLVGLIVWQIGLRLPPSGIPLFQGIGDVWNGISGPSWCLLFLYATLVRSGLNRASRPIRSDAPMGSPVPSAGLVELRS